MTPAPKGEFPPLSELSLPGCSAAIVSVFRFSFRCALQRLVSLIINAYTCCVVNDFPYKRSGGTFVWRIWRVVWNWRYSNRYLENEQWIVTLPFCCWWSSQWLWFRVETGSGFNRLVRSAETIDGTSTPTSEAGPNTTCIVSRAEPRSSAICKARKALVVSMDNTIRESLREKSELDSRYPLDGSNPARKNIFFCHISLEEMSLTPTQNAWGTTIRKITHHVYFNYVHIFVHYERNSELIRINSWYKSHTLNNNIGFSSRHCVFVSSPDLQREKLVLLWK